jgi:hypothetical protein
LINFRNLVYQHTNSETQQNRVFGRFTIDLSQILGRFKPKRFTDFVQTFIIQVYQNQVLSSFWQIFLSKTRFSAGLRVGLGEINPFFKPNRTFSTPCTYRTVGGIKEVLISSEESAATYRTNVLVIC